MKQKQNRYVVYLSERVREGERVRSKDKYLFSLNVEELENRTYNDKVQFTALSDEEKGLVINKLDSINVPLQATANNVPLHNTTRIEAKVTDCDKVIGYDFYVEDKLVRSFDSLDLENARISFLCKVLLAECKEQGIDADSLVAKDISDELINLWEYHRSIKEREDKARQEACTYYENTILSLQMKIAELQYFGSGIGKHTTADTMKVKKIYRALASSLHPDNEGGSHELMQMLNELKDMIN